MAHYPELVTPFGWSLYEPASDAAVRAMCRDFGLVLAGLDQVSIGGEVYVRPVPNPSVRPNPRGPHPRQWPWDSSPGWCRLSACG